MERVNWNSPEGRARLGGPRITDYEREVANFEAWKRRVAFKEEQWKARIAAMEPAKTKPAKKRSK